MTAIDSAKNISGYWPSHWPAESGGPRRQKITSSAGLNLQTGETLDSTVRETDGWAVMTIQRNPGEMYLLCGAALGPNESPPTFRSHDSHGWVERVDPISLQTITRSIELPSGGWLWCGALVAHANGDIYAVNGNYIFRLDSKCNVITQKELSFDGPFNGLLVMADGNLVTRNLGFRENDQAYFIVLDPENLEEVSEPLILNQRCMGRFSSDRSSSGEFIYTTTDTDVLRLKYLNNSLTIDHWKRSYEIQGEVQSDAWDTTIGDDRIWLMDMGRPPGWMTPGKAAQRAFGFSINDENEQIILDNHRLPYAWNPGPPLFDPIRKILVHYDSINGGIVGHICPTNSQPQMIWRYEANNYLQMMAFSDTGELIVENAELPPHFGGDVLKAEAVVLNIETGEELGKANTGSPSLGMFSSPGFSRDFYIASLLGSIARVFVREE